MEATVFSAYETEIELSTLDEVVENHNVTNTDTITIDNNRNSKQYPYLSITTSNTVVLSEVICGGNSVSGSINLSSGDTLILDFKEQEYTLNGSNIVDDLTFNDDDRPVINEDSNTDLSFTIDNPIDVELRYNSYGTIIQRDFVRDLRISVETNYNESRKFKKPNLSRLIKDSENFNVSFSNLAYNWEIYNAIENGKPIRISYTEDHTSEAKTYNKDLLGVKFGTYERFYRDSTGIIIESLTGQGTKLI